MLNEREVYFNGEYRTWDEANVHIMSHGFGRGSAIFEVIGFHETPAGPAVFRLDEYISRFWKSAALLEMELPLTQAALQAAVLRLVKRSGLKSGFLKMHGFYPDISFNVLPPQKRIQVAVCVFSAEEMFGTRKDIAKIGVTACISRWRRLDPQTIPIEAKVAGNYVNGMVARMESREKGFDYAVLLDTQGFLAEGGTESLFLVREGCLMTPALGMVLKSISRKTLLEVAGTMGIETFTGQLSPGLLDEAEEIFFSATANKLIPVRQVGERILSGIPGPVTRRLSEKMAAITSGRDGQFQRWLFLAE
jgi:branched-chain amino acid aminotransferase